MESPEIKAMLGMPDFHLAMGWPAAKLPAPKVELPFVPAYNPRKKVPNWSFSGPTLPIQALDLKWDDPKFQANLNTPGFCEKFKLAPGGAGLNMESPEIKAMLGMPEFHADMGWTSLKAGT